MPAVSLPTIPKFDQQRLTERLRVPHALAHRASPATGSAVLHPPLIEQGIEQPRLWRPPTLAGRPAQPRYADIGRESARMHRRGLFMGHNREDGQPIYLDLRHMKTHLHLLGLTQSGKTAFATWLLAIVAHDPHAIVFAFDFGKGGFFDLCRAITVSRGYNRRLRIWDWSDPRTQWGYNPLKSNGLDIYSHAKMVREAVRSAWGASTTDFLLTAQLARFLYLTLLISRMFEYTFVHALQILRPNSALRKQILPRLKERDPYVYESICYIDTLNLNLQNQLLAPCIARLEDFVLDETIRNMLIMQENVFDFSDAMTPGSINLFNLAAYQPFRRDDQELIARMMSADLAAKVYERYYHHKKTSPYTKMPRIYVFCDEFQHIASLPFIDMLDEGAELGISCVLSNQFLQQLKDEDKSGYLYYSVKADARTKILFDALPEDIEALSKDVFLSRYDPFTMLKDELTSLETEMVEERRTSYTTGRSGSRGRARAVTDSRSVADSESETHGTNWATARTVTDTINEALTLGNSLTTATGRSHTSSDAVAHTQLTSETQLTAEGETIGTLHTEGVVDSDGRGMTRTYQYASPYAAMPSSASRSWQDTAGTSRSAQDTDSSAKNRMRTRGTTNTEGVTEQHGESDTFSTSKALTDSESQTRGSAHSIGTTTTEGGSHARTTGQTITNGRSLTNTESQEAGWNEGETDGPFLAPYARRVVSSRQYLSWEEFCLVMTRLGKEQAVGQFILKVPQAPFLFLNGPWYRLPQLSRAALERTLDRIALPAPRGEGVHDVIRH